MRRKRTAAMAGAALLASIGAANARDHVALTDTQLDAVTAGYLMIDLNGVTVSVNGTTVSVNGAIVLNANTVFVNGVTVSVDRGTVSVNGIKVSENGTIALNGIIALSGFHPSIRVGPISISFR